MFLRACKKLVCAAVIFVLFLLICQLIYVCLYRHDRNAMITFTDYRQVETIEVAVIGSSVPRYGLDPFILQDALGKEIFMLTQYAVKAVGEKALLSELFLSHKPEYVIAVFDNDFLNGKSENVIVEASLDPYLRSVGNRFSYYWNAANQDGLWLTRMFPWRTLHISKLKELPQNALNHWNLTQYSQDVLRRHSETVDDIYKGKGFYSRNKEQDRDEILRRSKIKTSSEKVAVSDHVRDMILDMKRMCEKQNSKFMIVTMPNHPIYALSHQDVLGVGEGLREFCEENGIDYFNFQLLKSARTVELDACFYDSFHFNADGAQQFSPLMGQVLSDYIAGKDVADDFYSEEEYLACFNRIFNAWYDRKADDASNWIYQANTVQDTSAVAEFRFTVVDANGEETVVQDYSENSRFIYPRVSMKDKTMRLYVRNRSDLSQAPIIYE